MKIKSFFSISILSLLFFSSFSLAGGGWYKVEGVGSDGSSQIWINIRNPHNNNSVSEMIINQSRFGEKGLDRAAMTTLAALHTSTWCWFNYIDNSNGRDEITSYYCNRDSNGN